MGQPAFSWNLAAFLERVQRKAARFVCNDYSMYSSVTNILNRMHWSTLQIRRENLRLIMIYKIVNNLVEIETGNSLIKNDLPTRGHLNRFKHLPELIRLNIPSTPMQLNC